MKTVLLAGGFGTRISEESYRKPKPMVEIGGMPILWHIMKHYSSFGFNDFIICAGYKQQVIKEWFANYFLNTCDITFDFTSGEEIIVHNRRSDPWKVTVVDTGLHTMTGGRVQRIREYLDGDSFMLTYGDGVSDVNIPALLEFHQNHGKLATITAIRPDNRFGIIDIDGDKVLALREKSQADAGWINGGFMVLQKDVIDYIQDDTVMFERQPMETIAANGQMMCYRHNGFWQCMDTMRDKEKLENLWASGNAPWKSWNE